jgi:hypothetical protein
MLERSAKSAANGRMVVDDKYGRQKAPNDDLQRGAYGE